MSTTRTPRQDLPHAPASMAAEGLAIAAGGAVGASLRYAVAIGTQTAHQHAAWATAAANVLGAFALGVIVARVDLSKSHPLLRPFLAVGVFGSFTTFSALAFDNRLLASQHSEVAALLHLTGSIAAGLIAFAAGASLHGGRR
jgi:fluoride exporter